MQIWPPLVAKVTTEFAQEGWPVLNWDESLSMAGTAFSLIQPSKAHHKAKSGTLDRYSFMMIDLQ
jgi:hypothetical protein